MVTAQVRGGRGGGGGFRLRNLGLIFGEEKERRKSFYGGENPQRRDHVLTGAEGTMLEAEGARRRRKGNLNKKKPSWVRSCLPPYSHSPIPFPLFFLFWGPEDRGGKESRQGSTSGKK